jgi:ubiquinone/menaquinone biosynthesis C-methylase UbiE
MLTEENEKYYLEQYWANLVPILPDPPSKIRILDLACGHGRFTLHLAQYFINSSIVGVDISREALEFAEQSAQSRHITNVAFFNLSIQEYIKENKNRKFDIIVATEAFFFNPDWKTILRQLETMLTPGGIIITSFRSRLFNILYSVKNKSFEDATYINTNETGQIWGSPITFSWLSSDEFIAFKNKYLKSEIVLLTGIGVLSGIEGDPHQSIAEPKGLSSQQQKQLLSLELSIGKQFPDTGRYVLVALQNIIKKA